MTVLYFNYLSAKGGVFGVSLICSKDNKAIFLECPFPLSLIKVVLEGPALISTANSALKALSDLRLAAYR